MANQRISESIIPRLPPLPIRRHKMTTLRVYSLFLNSLKPSSTGVSPWVKAFRSPGCQRGCEIPAVREVSVLSCAEGCGSTRARHAFLILNTLIRYLTLDNLHKWRTLLYPNGSISCCSTEKRSKIARYRRLYMQDPINRIIDHT